MILGLDEAGRGPVLGPLVLCGVWLRDDGDVGDLDLRDSKAYGSGPTARARRRELAREIRRRAACVRLRVAEAAEVDRRVAQGQLNQLERELAQQLIDSGPAADLILADGARLFGPLRPRYPALRAEDRADRHHLAVAAASVVAKDRRDARFARLVAPYEPELGPVRGGGYANRGTEAFLRAYVQRHGALPPGVRRSWRWPVLAELDPAAATQVAFQLSLNKVN